MAVLPTPGSPMRTALFFVRRQSTCWTRSSSWSRPTSGSSWFFIAASVRSRLNSARSGVSFDARERRLLVEELDDVLADGVEPHPLFHEDRGGHRPLFAKDAEQQVLSADVVVEEPVRLFGGKLQDPLGFGAERYLDRRRDFLAEDRAALDFLANGLERQVRAGEDPAGESLAFADQPKEQVLGLDRNAPNWLAS